PLLWLIARRATAGPDSCSGRAASLLGAAPPRSRWGSQEQGDRIMTLVGKPAPDFSVDGYFKGKFETYKLGTLKGKWTYLLFYPLDYTFVCPTEVLSFSKSAKEFSERNCQILGVSVDSKFTHKAWVESKREEGGLGGSLNYPLLGDLTKNMS